MISPRCYGEKGSEQSAYEEGKTGEARAYVQVINVSVPVLPRLLITHSQPESLLTLDR